MTPNAEDVEAVAIAMRDDDRAGLNGLQLLPSDYREHARSAIAALIERGWSPPPGTGE
jgi:hypothetical protein